MQQRTAQEQPRTRYPSRRSLRAAARAESPLDGASSRLTGSGSDPDLGSAIALVAPGSVQPDAGAKGPEPASDEPDPGSDAPDPGSDALDAVLTPRPRARSAVPAPSHAPARSGRRRPLRALVGVAASGGLLLTAGLPAFGFVADFAAAPAHQQSLALGEGLDDSPEQLDDFGRLGAPTPLTGAQFSLGGLSAFTNVANAPVQYPVTDNVTLTDGFGFRTAPVHGFHDGQDFAAPAGTPVRAMADGVVLEVGGTSDGCGFGVKLEHEIDEVEAETITTRYCHMGDGSSTLSVGDRVSVGEQIGEVGNTGMSFGAHLHFVLTVDGEAVDPMPFLAAYNRAETSSGRTSSNGASSPG